MGYLDYAGLQYLWSKLKEKFAPKSHTHDDRYYTEAEMDGKLNSKVNNNEAGANGLLSKLTTSWTATPTDNTYFIRQDTGGGNSFGRVKFSTLWTYIKSKADGVYQPKGSYAASSHTHDDRYYTESEINTKLSGYLPTAGGTMNGTIAFSDSSHGKIYSGPTDNVNGPGGDLNNIVIESWNGLSFTTGCPNQTYTGKTAVGIDCREGVVKAARFDGTLTGTAATLGGGGNPYAPMTFNWSGKDGQPTWLWGGEDGVNMYVYNPANFVVHYADWANGANNGVVSYGFGSNSDGYIRFINGVQICWGRTNCSGKDTTINFSAAFSNSSYSVSTMPFYSNLAGTYWNVKEGSMGTTGFVLHGSKSSIDLRTILWIAIGKWN